MCAKMMFGGMPVGPGGPPGLPGLTLKTETNWAAMQSAVVHQQEQLAATG